MIIKNNNSYDFICADRSHGIIPDDIRFKHYNALLYDSALRQVMNSLRAESLVLLHQTHSIKGMQIRSLEQAHTMQLLQTEGDYIITNQPKIALGVLTADCLPLVLYDPNNHAIGIAHAGWKGTVAGIAITMLQHMKQAYGTCPEHIQILCGPCARACCYQVGDDFVQIYGSNAKYSKAFIQRNNTWYFDTIMYNMLLLQEHGVPDYAFDTSAAVCTIEDEKYCSYRRNKTKMRQISLVTLK